MMDAKGKLAPLIFTELEKRGKGNLL